MSQSARTTDQHFTYGDYCRWPDDERWELIDGQPFSMCPAPTRRHQKLLVEMLRQIADQLQDRECEVYVAPFDVRLPEADEADEAISNVVQPDLAVICDLAKLDDAGCRGAPDWIVEVLSPSTAVKDQTDKLRLYQRHGVREYWLVHPTDRVLTIYRLHGDTYGPPAIQSLTGECACVAVPGLRIRWPEPEDQPETLPSPAGSHAGTH